MSRVVLVTGGMGGIGRAVVDALARDGYCVLAPGHAALDLGSPESVAAWLSVPVPPIDAFVNCAGVNEPAPLAELSAERWSRTLAINATGPFLLVRALGAAMAVRGCGRIVSVSSLYAARAREGRAAYSASKAAMEALTRSAALEFGPRGVLVNAVAPGFVDTDMTRRNNTSEQVDALRGTIPLGRLATPEEVADVVVWLASERNTYLTGQTVVVDGGASLR